MRGEFIVKKLFAIYLLAVACTVTASAQFPQMRTVEERTQQKGEDVRRVEDEKRRLEGEPKVTQPVIKPSVMNVDVQLVLTKLEYKDFATAKPFNVTRIADGDPLWLYFKFNGKLGDWVYTMRNSDGTERYLLFAEYGPQGDVTAKSHQIIEFRKDELKITELKMSLAPGKAGNNNALEIFIKNISAARPGLWSNELRISRNAGFPRAANDYLAKIGFACDFSKGISKYPAMMPGYHSMILRDSLDERILPIEGKLDDSLARASFATKLAEAGIVPSRIYFAADNWLEYSDQPISVRQYRKVTGVFLFQREGTCFYGTADIVQPFDAMNNSFTDATVSLGKPILTTCQ